MVKNLADKIRNFIIYNHPCARELASISERNLGRDDRIVSDHGVTARFPFLDEDLVSFLSSLELSLKCDFRLGRGLGEKLVLRLAAHSLGLVR